MSNKRVPSKLLSLVKPEDKERFIHDYHEYNWVLGVIKEAVQKEVDVLQLSEELEDNFSDTNWDKLMAYKLGGRKYLRKVLNLFPTKGDH